MLTILPLLRLLSVTLLRISFWLRGVAFLPSRLRWWLLLILVDPDIFRIFPFVVCPVIRILAAAT